LVGFNLNWGLLGITIVQIYIYHLSFPNDSKYLKCIVYFLAVIDLSSSILIMADNYRWFGAGFGNMNTLTTPRLAPTACPILDGFIALVVQLFYSYRI
ncbi:hypothetical protein K435DRAFT_556720, partial [Dendrothele bispora CBS 962.96]